MSLDDILTHDRRLLVLQALSAAGGYALHERVIQQTIEASSAAVSGDRLRTDLDWLEEQGLIGIERGDPWLTKITRRGDDVANGRARVAGVQRPAPGAA